MRFNSLYSALRVKLANFEQKYGHVPQVIIVNPVAKYADMSLEECIGNDFPFLPNVKIIHSARIRPDDFEIY